MTLERRRDRRFVLQRPVKMQCDQTGIRYLSGRVVNISEGGAMLLVDHAQRLRHGQEVRLLIAAPAPATLLNDRDAMSGTIVRSLGCSDTQHVGIRFAKPHRIAEAC